MSDYEEKIRRGVLLYLREVHNITASDAYIGDMEVHREWSGGCETCGWYEENVTTDISYVTEGKVNEATWGARKSVTLELSEQSILPLMLPYIDRAN